MCCYCMCECDACVTAELCMQVLRFVIVAGLAAACCVAQCCAADLYKQLSEARLATA